MDFIHGITVPLTVSWLIVPQTHIWHDFGVSATKRAEKVLLLLQISFDPSAPFNSFESLVRGQDEEKQNPF